MQKLLAWSRLCQSIHKEMQLAKVLLDLIDLQQLVDEISALWLNLHILWPFYTSRVDFWEDCVALCSCEWNLAGDHFEYNASKRPKICREGGHLCLDHLRCEVVHRAD